MEENNIHNLSNKYKISMYCFLEIEGKPQLATCCCKWKFCFFKSNSKFWWFYCQFWAWLAPSSDVSVVDFEQVSAGWVLVLLMTRFRLTNHIFDLFIYFNVIPSSKSLFFGVNILCIVRVFYWTGAFRTNSCTLSAILMFLTLLFNTFYKQEVTSFRTWS